MTKANGKSAVGSAVVQLNAEIETLRERRARLLDEFHEIEGRPVPEAELAQRVEQVVRGLQAQATTLVGTDLLHSESPVSGLVADLLAKPVKPLALAAVLQPDVLRSWLLAQARNEARTLPEAMPAAERAERLKTLEAQVLETERAEAALLWEGEASGLVMPWRQDLDPRAVLGLA
jgi:hypothetical protein